jgi:hypothetical protein
MAEKRPLETDDDNNNSNYDGSIVEIKRQKTSLSLVGRGQKTQNGQPQVRPYMHHALSHLLAYIFIKKTYAGSRSHISSSRSHNASDWAWRSSILR